MATTTIQWDGNTEGLESTDGGFYRVADYVYADTGYIEIAVGTESLVVNNFIGPDTGEDYTGMWLLLTDDNTEVVMGLPVEFEGISPGIYIRGVGLASYTLYLDIAAPVSTFTPAEFLRWFSLGQAVRRGAVKQEWEVLFEGTVTQSPIDVYMIDPWPWNGYDTNRLSVGDVIRVTIAGTVEQHTVEQMNSPGFVKAGNEWLDSGFVEDDGDDFFCWEYGGSLRAFIRNWDYTDLSNPTQTLKIERRTNA